MPTHSMGEGISGGNKAAKGLDDTTASAKNLHSVLKDIEKTVSKLLSDFGKMSSSIGASKSGGVSLPNGMGGAPSPGAFNQDLATEIQSVTDTLSRKFTPPPTTGERIATGLGYATKFAFGAMSMMPNTDDAVTQRITAQSVASMSGMSALNLISTSNALLQGGMTSPYSAQTSTAALASSGILPTMGSYQNIMKQVGGFSILTGMPDEQTAAGFAGINGMNYLRLGIRVRNPDGSIKDPNEIANLLYKRMYGGRQVTAEQAAQVYNPHSRAYQDVMAAAGGDPALFQSLAAATVYQARNGGKKLDMSTQNVKDNILKLPKDDPMRAFYNYQGSEANKLGATGENLVKGYSDALNFTASANNLFASIAKYAGPIADGLARLAGILTTLPQAGNMGANLTGGIMGMGERLLDTATSRLEEKGINSVLDYVGLGKGEGGGGGGDGITFFGGKRGFKGGKEGALAAEEEALTLGKAVKNTGGLRSLFAKGGLKALAAESGGKSGLLKLVGRGLGQGVGKVFKGLMIAQLAKDVVFDPLISAGKHFGQDHFSSKTNKAGTTLARAGEYAALGATVGSFIPGLGTAIGAAAGAIIGTGVGLYKGMHETEGGAQDPNTGGDAGYTRNSWATELLKRLGVEENSENHKAIVNWELKEGGHWANIDKYNPLNTTQHMPGSHGTNSDDVQAYLSWEQGLQATVKTFGYSGFGYEKILKAFKEGSAGDIYQAVVDSHWGTTELMGHTKGGGHKSSGSSGSSGSSRGSSGSSRGSDRGKTHEGKRYRPTGGPITAHYGQKPKNNTYWQWKKYHTGTDYGVPKGTDVYAFTDGKVIKAGQWDGESFGTALLIDHGGYQSFYAHLNDIKVSPGQVVKGGQVVAHSGQTGSGAKMGPHLHFEIRKGHDNPVNPAKWLNGLSGETAMSASGGASTGFFGSIKNIIKKGVSSIEQFFNHDSSSSGTSTSTNPGLFGSTTGNIFSSDISGFSSTTGTGTAALAKPAATNTNSELYGNVNNNFGGDVSPSAIFGANAELKHDHNITINMNVTVSHGNTQDAVRLARDVKNILERELRVNKLSEF